ncbi:TonB C-terminal domain-containing protein [Tahibacter caeni]|uniref:TonB C-terminal domain-containing protein n=1 Tax=Tahibacter caeni TaxID=1453545 RepID=UPI002148D65B|nr:TonB C-terminal domain-containing protein [Tahibacter caeni]
MTAKTAAAVLAAMLLSLPAVMLAAEQPTVAPIAAYVDAVQAKIQRNWLAPEPRASDLDCAVDIEQDDGGAVVQVSFGNDCNADAATRASLEQAVRRASPLPYAGFESVFQRRVHLVFKHSGH